MRFRNKVILLSGAIAAFGLFAGIVAAQQSEDYDASWNVFGGGGGSSLSVGYNLDATVGQPVVGQASATGVQLQAGFWPGIRVAAESSPTPTPTPTATATPTPTATPTATPSPTPTPGPGYVLQLEPGWNLVSKPALGSVETAALLSPIADMLDIAWGRDASVAPDGLWLSYVPTAPPFLNSLLNIDEKMGFWLFLQEEADLHIDGQTPESTIITVYGGRWNLLGYPSNTERPVAEVLSGIQYEVICTFDVPDEQDPWKCFDPTVPAFLNDLQNLGPGKGYLMLATANGSYSVEH